MSYCKMQMHQYKSQNSLGAVHTMGVCTGARRFSVLFVFFFIHFICCLCTFIYCLCEKFSPLLMLFSWWYGTVQRKTKQMCKYVENQIHANMCKKKKKKDWDEWNDIQPEQQQEKKISCKIYRNLRIVLLYSGLNWFCLKKICSVERIILRWNHDNKRIKDDCNKVDDSQKGRERSTNKTKK